MTWCGVVTLSVASVCLSCPGSNFWTPWPINFIFGLKIHLYNIQVMVAYQAHGVKVKVKVTRMEVPVFTSGRSVCDWKAILLVYWFVAGQDVKSTFSTAHVSHEINPDMSIKSTLVGWYKHGCILPLQMLQLQYQSYGT